MKRFASTPGFIILTVALGGCGLDPLDRQPSVTASAAAPAYYVSERGQITPVACKREPRGGFGGLPPGCARDTALLAQVVHPNDVLHPRKAGQASSVPAARAAEAYIYGTDGAGAGGGGGEAPGRNPPLVVVPQAGNSAGE